MEKLLVPKLRFPEFKSVWDERFIGNILKIGSGKDYKHLNTGIYSVYGTGGYMTSVDEYLYDGESVCIGRKGTIDKPVYLNEKFWTVDTLFYTHSFKGVLPRFVFSLFQKINWYKYNEASGVPSLSKGTIEKIKLNIPQLEEQQKIATFLTVIDTKIIQLNDKKSLLEEYKKGVTQKIFRQELRFKDGNGNVYPEWIEKRLKDFVKDFIVPMRDKPKDLIGDIPWCRIEDFDGMYLYGSKSNQGVSLETVSNMNLKVYPINTLLVSCSANLGVCSIVKKKLITNQTFIGLVPNELEINVEFLYYTMKLSSRKLNVLSSGTTIAYLSRQQFEEFKVEVPCLNEQVKIANFLTAIDKKIELVQTQIDNTTSFKKGLLQQMFV
ncbi:restriction endonuclease subunit S [Aestuariibaculum sp. TT11]|uniref:Restriction endonuclease subunit S n=1 Tax=Aestuariibaculum sediminum TaxID=2770637 RepID=A0A8J6Q3B6_9FLAO|nr:restriction endonuclease subunit S [Aestuariibaculum sediminum]